MPGSEVDRRPGGAAVRGLEQPVVIWAIDRAPLDRIAKRRRRKSEIVEPRAPVGESMRCQVLPPLVERYTKLAPETAVTSMSLLLGAAMLKARPPGGSWLTTCPFFPPLVDDQRDFPS